MIHHTHRARVTKLLNVLVAVSLLLSSTPSASRAAPLPVVAREAGQNQPAPGRASLPEAGPSPSRASGVHQLRLPLIMRGYGPVEDVALIGPEGGVLASRDGRVRVEFPAGAVSAPAEARYVSGWQQVVAGRGPALRFELDLRSRAGHPLALARPVTLTVNVSGLMDLALQPDQWLYLAYLDEPGREWVRVPTRDDEEASTLTAQVDHFSTWETGMDGLVKSGWRLLYNPPQVSLFSGAATFAYPIEVLPGRGGLQPQLALAYNSRRVDGILSWVQSDWAGLGWSLDSIEIAREVGRANNGYKYQNKFTLLLNGASYRLVKDEGSGPAAYGRYRTQAHSGLYIERCNDLAVLENWSPRCAVTATNTTGEYWIVRTADGLTYTLGWTPDAEQVVGEMEKWGGSDFEARSRNSNDPDYAGRAKHTAASRWRVNLAQDGYGNQVEYLYDERDIVYYTDSSDDEKYVNKHYDAASYLREIRYNQRTVNGQPEYDRVVLLRRSRQGDKRAGSKTEADNAMFWQAEHLSLIQVKRGDTLVRQYKLDYQLPNASNRLLTSLVDQGQGVAASFWLTTTLGYVKNEEQDRGVWHGNKKACWGDPTLGNCPSDADDWDRAHFPYYRLAWVDNGYGGKTELIYKRDATHGPDFSTPYSYVVSDTYTLDGRGHTAHVGYRYDGGCWDRDGQPCANPVHKARSQTLIGYGWVREMAYNYAGAEEAHTVHAFRTDTWATAGRETRTEHYAAGTPLQYTEQSWDVQEIGSSTFVYLQAATTSQGSQVSRTTYEYDPAQQGGAQYGNLTAKIEYADGGSTPYRRTRWGYYPDPDRWIASKPGYQDVDEWSNSAWSLASATRYSYGGRGQLTAVRRWTGAWPEHFVDTHYTYDGWGNRLTETSYADYGTATALASLQPKTTATAYDATYHLYPVVVTDALTHTLRYGYDWARGLVLTATDANNVSTFYRYDGLGRLTKVIRPGDSEALPTVEFRYELNGDRHALQVYRREVSGQGVPDRPEVGTLWSVEWVDGLGRTYQSRTEAGDGSVVVQDTAHDAQGRVAWQSVPYTVTSGGLAVTLPELTRPRTTTQYDGLGRTLVVTAPDGTTTRYGYVGWTTTATDANGHRRDSTVDAFGRLAAVREYNGAETYLTTYAYTVLDNLARVTDALGHTTVIAYNALGQKTGMTDPDMGQWQYRYDTAGNLVKQLDARGVATCFYYDALNRLEAKTYHDRVSDLDNLACPGQAAAGVKYEYDEPGHGYGIGQRTRMAYPGGELSFAYDERGRLVTQTRAFDGVGRYMTSFTYPQDASGRDALDRLVTTTYPDGETTTQIYNAAAQPFSLSSRLGETLVSGAEYTALGQPHRVDYGNGLSMNYEYYLAAQDNNRLKRISIAGLLDLGYTYDDVGNVWSITDGIQGDQVQDFRYDALNRLTHARTSGGTNGMYNHTYQYDPTGNLIRFAGQTYGYGQAVGIAPGARPHAVTHVNGEERYRYDANGNMTWRAEGGFTYAQAFDAENRLVVVTSTPSAANTLGISVTRFYYDGDGARIAQVTPEGTTFYIGEHYEELWPGYEWKGGRPDRSQRPVRSASQDLTGLEDLSGLSYQATFDAQGLRFALKENGAALGYRLDEIRSGRLVFFSASDTPDAPPVKAGERVVYHRGHGLREEYLALAEGVEQLFILERPLPLEGDLQITGRLDTELAAAPYLAGQGIRFLDVDGQVRLRCGAVRVFDAAGRQITASLRLEGERLTIVVPGGWLAEASYPVTIDPLIGGDFQIAGGAGDQTQPLAVYNSRADEYVVLYREGAAIRGQRVSTQGQTIGSTFPVATGQNFAAAYSSQRNELLVAYESGAGVYAQRLLASGAITGSAVTISTTGALPDVAYNSADGEYLVAFGDNGSVYARRVSGQGGLIGSPIPLAQAACPLPWISTTYTSPAVAYNAGTGEYLAASVEDTTQCSPPYTPGECISTISLVAQRRSSSGEPLGARQTLATSGNNPDWRQVTLAPNSANGDFLAVWHEAPNTLRGQRVSSLGLPAGLPFDLSGTFDRRGLAYSPAVSEYLLTWHTAAPAGVFARRVAANGSLAGSAIGVPSLPGGQNSAVAARNGSVRVGLLVVWQDTRNGNADIYGQRVDLALPPAPMVWPEPEWTPGLTNVLTRTLVNPRGYRDLECRIARAPASNFSQGDEGGSGWLAQTPALTQTSAYLFASLVHSQTYYYRAQTRDSLGLVSAWSNVVSSSQDAYAPAQPTLPALPACTAGAAQSLNWTPVPDQQGGSGQVRYQAQCAENGQFSPVLAESAWLAGAAYTFDELADGHTYFYRLRARDAAGNTTSWSGSASSTQDARAPVGSLQVNGGAEWTRRPTVTLALAAADPVPGASLHPDGAMRFRNEGGGWSGWGSFATTATWTLSGGDGLKRVGVQYRDGVGNASEYSAAIQYDGAAPQVLTMTVAPGHFSPNGDGVQDSVTLTAHITDTHFSAWQLGILSGTRPVRHFGGAASDVSVVWDGRDGAGQPVGPGVYTVVVTGTDLAGNAGRAEWAEGVELDLTPPLTFTLGFPPKSYATNAATTPVVGMTERDTDRVIVGGQAVSVTAGYTFTAQVGLVAGYNVITATATDLAGNTAPVTTSVLYETRPPTITILSPAPGSLITDTRPALAAQFNDAGSGVDVSSLKVQRNGDDITAQCELGASGFYYTPPVTKVLEAGTHTLYVWLADRAGNMAQAKWSFGVDNATWVELDWPRRGYMNVLTTSVRGEAEPGAAVSVRVNGQPAGSALAGADEDYSLDGVALVSGTNVISVTATDGLGNRAEAAVTVTVNTGLPSAVVSTDYPAFSPNGDGRQDLMTFRLWGAGPGGAPPSGWRLFIADERGQVVLSTTGTGTLDDRAVDWDGRLASGRVLTDGVYLYTLVVTSEAGLSVATPSGVVTLDTAPPAAPSITWPGEDTYFNQASFRLAGTTEAGGDIRALNQEGLWRETRAASDGARPDRSLRPVRSETRAASDGAWELRDFPLTAMENLISLRATDAAGNTSEPTTRRVFKTVAPPLYSVDIHPSLAVSGTLVTLTAQARGYGSAEGAPTAWVRAMLPVSQTITLVEDSPGLTITWQTTWTVGAQTPQAAHLVRFDAADRSLPPARGWGLDYLYVRHTLPAPPDIELPAAGFIAQATQRIHLYGRAGRGDEVRLYLDGAPAATTIAASNGFWDLALTLAEGRHALWATARDAYGLESAPSRVVRVTIDLTPPTMSGAVQPPVVRWDGFITATANVSDSLTGVAWATAQVAGCRAIPLTDQGNGQWRNRYPVCEVPLPDGTRSLVMTAADGVGNPARSTTTLVLDNTPPTGALAINDGAEYTNQRAVRLGLWATDAHTVTHLRAAPTEPLLDWAAWEAYAPTRAYELEAGPDNPRAVWVQYRDVAGNASLGYSDVITLDTQAPLVQVSRIVESSSYAYAPGHTLYYGRGAGSFGVRVGLRDAWPGRLGHADYPPMTSPGGRLAAGPDEIPGTVEHEYTFQFGYQFWPTSTEEHGQYPVVIADRAANTTTLVLQLARDLAAPASTTTSPAYDNGGAILVGWTAADSHADDVSGVGSTRLWYRLADGAWTDSGLWAIGTAGSIGFFPPGGVNGVYAFSTVSVDNVGNQESGPSGNGRTRTVYDTHPPTSTITSAPALVRQGPITLTWQAVDNLSGVALTELWQRAGRWGKWQTSQSSGGSAGAFAVTPPADGVYYFATRSRDVAGNAEWAHTPPAGQIISTTYDGAPPVVNVDAAIQDDNVRVAWHASDAGSGVSTCMLRVREEQGAWRAQPIACAGVLTYTAVWAGRAYTFSVQATDRAGNTGEAGTYLTYRGMPPTVSLSAPAIVREANVPLTWSGSDTGSGLAWYDITVSADGGPYAPWLIHTTQTRATYISQPGHLYRFRITAVDRRGNTASAEAQAGLVRVTKYYAFGGQRVAMRQGGVLYYLHADHIGSTSLATYGSGPQAGQEAPGSRTGYLPFGQVRFGGEGLPTDLTFTGQRNDASTGLMYYKARYYDAALGRFISADTLVPEPGSPQSLNRYSYTRNNSLKYVDPTGHDVGCPGNDASACSPDPTQAWAEFYTQDPARLMAEMLVWMQDHQDLDQIIAMSAYLESAYGSSLAGLSQEFTAIYGHAFATAQLPQLIENREARLIAGNILTTIGVGGYISLGGSKREIAGSPSFGTQAVQRGVPNPDGRLGGSEHQLVVEQIKMGIGGRGLTPRGEFQVNTPGGRKPYRFVDAVALDVNGNPVEFYQVGRITESGLPIARERYAIIDIFEFGSYNIPIHFIPYYP